MTIIINQKEFNLADKNKYDAVNSILHSFSSNPEDLYVVVQGAINKIKDNKFEHMYNLKYISLLNSEIKCISSYAFKDCINLCSVDLPNNLCRINKGAFLNCKSLSNILIPSNVNYIGTAAFENCTELNTVCFGTNNMTVIDKYAFRNCKSLKYIQLPRNIDEISVPIFEDCFNLTTIGISQNLFDKYGKKILNRLGLTNDFTIKDWDYIDNNTIYEDAERKFGLTYDEMKLRFKDSDIILYTTPKNIKYTL